MNCLEFRRAIGTDPNQLDATALAHRDACARCAEAFERAATFERVLGAAIAVDVPAQLAERILLHQTTQARHEAPLRQPWRWQIAAGVMLALAATTFWQWRQRDGVLSDVAVAHLSHEPYALSARAVVPTAEVKSLFAALDAPLRADLGPVHYANDCSLGHWDSAHLVFQQPGGPVTALFVPRHREPRQTFERAGVRGRELPIGGGTLVLLAADARDFDAVVTAFVHAFTGASTSAVGAP